MIFAVNIVASASVPSLVYNTVVGVVYSSIGILQKCGRADYHAFSVSGFNLS